MIGIMHIDTFYKLRMLNKSGGTYLAVSYPFLPPVSGAAVWPLPGQTFAFSYPAVV